MSGLHPSCHQYVEVTGTSTYAHAANRAVTADWASAAAASGESVVVKTAK